MCWKSGSLPDPCSLCRPERGCLRTAKPRPSLSDCQSVELPICFSKKLFLLYIQEDLTGELYPFCLRRYFVSRALFLLMGQALSPSLASEVPKFLPGLPSQRRQEVSKAPS